MSTSTTYEEYELDKSELEPPRPMSAERRAEIDEINSEIAKVFREICEMG